MASMNKKIIQGKMASAGYSALEVLIAVAVGLILVAMAIPGARSAIATYELDAAVDSAEGAIQGPRYQAIMHGYPYQVDFNSATNLIQVSSEIPPAVTFTATGSAVPISAEAVVLGVGTASGSSAGHLTLQFKGNGSVSISSGQTAPAVLTITYNGVTRTLTVSNYGSVSVQ